MAFPEAVISFQLNAHLSYIDRVARLEYFRTKFEEAFSKHCSRLDLCNGKCMASRSCVDPFSPDGIVFSVCSTKNFVLDHTFVVNYWDIERYKDINPFLLYSGSSKSYHFKCCAPCGHHHFERELRKITPTVRMCPYCDIMNGSFICPCDSLKTFLPNIELWFDAETAKKEGMEWRIEKIAPRERTALHLRCPRSIPGRERFNTLSARVHRAQKTEMILPCQNIAEHHRWKQPITRKTKKLFCPYCEQLRACPCNSASIQNPFLLKLLDPLSLTYHDDVKTLHETVVGSEKKIRVVCDNGHHREMKIRELNAKLVRIIRGDFCKSWCSECNSNSHLPSIYYNEETIEEIAEQYQGPLITYSDKKRWIEY